MAKRRLKKVPKAADLTHAAERLRKALVKRTKDELVDVLVELAREDHKLLRRLDARFELEAPPKELVAATRQAIADATDFDEREINYNFDYDYEACSEVKRNLGRLIDQGYLRQAMELSLELMKEGSCQVEMSDEGLMTSDIEECFSVTVASGASCVGWYLGRIGFREFHQNGKGYEDGEVTRRGEGAILARDDPAIGGERSGGTAVLRAGRGARAPFVLVAAKVAGRPRRDSASAKHQES